jgi:hypothetical protein
MPNPTDIDHSAPVSHELRGVAAAPAAQEALFRVPQHVVFAEQLDEGAEAVVHLLDEKGHDGYREDEDADQQRAHVREASLSFREGC